MASIKKRETPKGTAYWEVRIRRKGNPPLCKSCKSEKEANVWATDQESKINKGQRVTRAAEKFTVADAVNAYMDDIDSAVVKLATIKNKLRDLRTVRHDLGTFIIAGLTRKHISDYLKHLAKTPISPPTSKKKTHPLYNGDKVKLYSPATIRKFYYALKQAVEWHSREERYPIEPDLFTKQPVPSGWSGERDRRLEEGEEERLHAAIDKGRDNKAEWKNLISFALETAMRDQEMLKAVWSDLNLEGRTLNIPAKNTKTGIKRQVPLSSKAVDILKNQKERCPKGERRIFYSWASAATVSRGFHTISARAKTEDLKFHDLRHEATSRLFEKGKLSLMEIMKITGHKEISTIERYTHLHPSELAHKLD